MWNQHLLSHMKLRLETEHLLNIDPELIMEISGQYYLLLSRTHMTTRRIMTMASRDDHSRDVGAMTMFDIPEQLAAARDSAMRTFVAGSCHEDQLPKQWAKIKVPKRHRAALQKLPEVIEITTPLINDMQQIKMNVVTAYRGNVHIEMIVR